MLVKIKESTDGKFIGAIIETDLKQIIFPENNIFEITGRCHIGNGEWNLWNSNYFIKVEEVQVPEE